jgi:Zn-dependent protease
LGSIGGISIYLHYTWLLAFFLIVWSLAMGYFPMSSEPAGSVTYWVLGAVAAVLLFASVLVHELGHSFVARARGLRVDNITLFIFGGVSNITREPRTARDEFLISVVGPLISLVLAALFWLIGRFLTPGSPVGAVATYLASANLLLGLFNIVPAFPLDGGRVFRSIVWAVTGDMLRATQVASYIGQLIAWVLIGWGVLQAIGGDVFGGLWTGFIGWFLNSGAETSRQQASAESILARVPVTSVMDAAPERLSPALTVNDFVLEHVIGHHQRALPVVEDGRVVGIMSVTDAKHLDQSAWPTSTVGDVMTRMPLKTLGPDANVADALQLMVDSGVHQVPIVDNDALVGMVSRADVMRALQSGLGVVGERGSARTEVISANPKTAASHG